MCPNTKHCVLIMEKVKVSDMLSRKNTRKSSLPKRIFLITVTLHCQDGLGKVHPCTGTEALYRPYGP